MKAITINNILSHGNYIIKIYHSNYLFIIPYRIIYDSNFDLKNSSPAIFYENKNYKISDLILEFRKYEYKDNQIKEIYYIKDLTDSIIIKYSLNNYTFDNNNFKLTFQNNDLITDNSQYHIEIKGYLKIIYNYFHKISINSTLLKSDYIF